MTLTRFFLLLPFIFVFFPAFVIFLSKQSRFPVLLIFVVIAYLFILIFYKKNVVIKIIEAFKYTAFRYFMYIYAWIIVSGLLAVCCGYYSLAKFLIVVFFNFVFKNILTFLYPVFIIPRFLSIKNVIRIFTTMYVIICVWGLVEFVGATFNIDIINTLVGFFSNIRSGSMAIVFDKSTNMVRIRSLFMEPSFLAKFLVINAPIIYALALTKYKIFKDKYINLIVKKSLIPLFLLCLLLTQSPIWLVFALLVSLVYFYKNIINFIFKYKKILLILILLFVISGSILFKVSNIDISKTYLSRIGNLLAILGKFNLIDFILIEQSLAKRVIDFILQIKLFLHHPIVGFGYGNVEPIVMKLFYAPNIPLTEEHIFIQRHYDQYFPMSTNAMYMLLWQTGIIGFVLYLIFMFKNIKILNKVKNYIQGIDKVFVQALISYFITFLFMSVIYEQAFNDEYFFFMCGIAVAITLYTRHNVIKENLKNGE